MEEVNLMRQKCLSLPTFTKTHEQISNISAPFDLYCLKGDHKFPPFAKPICDPRPRLVIDSIVNQADMVNIVKILQFELNKKQLIGDYLVKKGIIDEHVTEKEFLVSLFLEAIDYAAQKHLNALKLACLLNIYMSTHCYMKSKDWRQPKQIWDYFKEVLIRLTIEDSPDGQEVFSPEESYDILSHFHTIYLSNLSLIHLLAFGAYRVRFVWPCD